MIKLFMLPKMVLAATIRGRSLKKNRTITEARPNDTPRGIPIRIKTKNNSSRI
jgi:hypothetical protein